MTAMTLLRAMSELDPQDLEAALRAGKNAVPDETADAASAAETTGIGGVIGIPLPQPPAVPIRHFRIAAWTAVVASLALLIGTLLHFRQQESGLVLAPSFPDEITEVTATDPPQTTTASAEAESSTAPDSQQQAAAPVQTVTRTVTEAAQTDPETALTETEPPQIPQTVPPAEEPLSEPETTVTYAAQVPVLVAMADEGGSLTHPDGSDFADGEYIWEAIPDADAAESYLNGDAPVVTIGGGQKSDAVTAQIRQNEEMLRIRWQMQDAVWDSYGICSAKLDSSGVLHLEIAMYSEGVPKPESEWIYETALLYESGTLPPVSDIDVQFLFYEDTADDTLGIPGIVQWLAFMAELEDDVYIRIDS